MYARVGKWGTASAAGAGHIPATGATSATVAALRSILRWHGTLPLTTKVSVVGPITDDNGAVLQLTILDGITLVITTPKLDVH